MPRPVVYKKQLLGQIFLKRGLITKDQLKEALAVQKKEGGILGELLIKLGYLEERNLVMGLSMQCSIPYLPPARYKIDKEIVKIIPNDFAKSNHVICIDKFQDVLTVVLSNPLDKDLIQKVMDITECDDIGLCIATVKEIEEAIKNSY